MWDGGSGVTSAAVRGNKLHQAGRWTWYQEGSTACVWLTHWDGTRDIEATGSTWAMRNMIRFSLQRNVVLPSPAFRRTCGGPPRGQSPWPPCCRCAGGGLMPTHKRQLPCQHFDGATRSGSRAHSRMPYALSQFHTLTHPYIVPIAHIGPLQCASVCGAGTRRAGGRPDGRVRPRRPSLARLLPALLPRPGRPAAGPAAGGAAAAGLQPARVRGGGVRVSGRRKGPVGHDNPSGHYYMARTRGRT